MADLGENRILGFLAKHSRKFIVGSVILTVLALAAMGGLWWSYKDLKSSDSEILATVGNEEITKVDLNELIYASNYKGSVDNPEEVSQEQRNQYFEQLVRWAAVKQEANKLGITVSDEEYQAELKARLGGTNYANFDKNYTSAQQELTKKIVTNEVLSSKVEAKVVAWREGQVVVARFDKYAGSAPDEYTDAQKAEWDSVKDQKYQEDKAYAAQKINALYTDLAAGKITGEEAVAATLSDNKLNNTYFSPWTVALSLSFDKDDYQSYVGMLANSEVRDALAATESGYSEIKLANLDNEDGDQVASYYFFANVTGGNASSAETLSDWLTEKLAGDYKIKLYADEFGGLINVKKTSWLATPAYAYSAAECQNSYGNKWGVHGSSGSTVGLVVHTVSYDVSGNTSNLNGISYQITAGRAGSYIYVGTDGTRATKNTFITGDPFYKTSDSGNTCIIAGYSVLGYGTSPNGTNVNSTSLANWGNRYSLGCSGNPFTVTLTSSPSGLGSWETASQVVNVENGSGSVTLTFNWHVTNPNKLLTVKVDPTGVATTVPVAEVTHPVASGSVINPTYRITDTSLYEFGSWEGCTSTSGDSCSVTMDVDKTVTLHLKKISPQLSCEVSPQTGLSPLVVKVETSYKGLGSDPKFTYDFEETTQTDKPATVYYTYSTAGEYEITVSNPNYNNGTAVPCDPAKVIVTNPASSSGGEVRP